MNAIFLRNRLRLLQLIEIILNYSVNGQNVHQGKLGAAILKNVAEKDVSYCKLVVYYAFPKPLHT